MEKKEPLFTVCGRITGVPITEISLEVSQKAKTRTAILLNYNNIWNIPQDSVFYGRDAYTSMFITILFTIPMK